MLLKQLKLRNYGIFDSIDIDLTNVKLASIIGRWHGDPRRSNGAGKSTLLEAIRYALFGVARRSRAESIIREGQISCEVDLTVIVNNHTIRVLRGKTASGSTAKLWINDQPAGDQTRMVDARVAQYVGIDGELFDLVFFFRQDDQTTFVTTTPGERKAFFARIFNMSPYDACYAATKTKRQYHIDVLHNINGSITTLEYEMKELGGLFSLTTALEMAEEEFDRFTHCLCLARFYANGLIFDDRNLVAQLTEFDRDLSDKTTQLKYLLKAVQTNLHELTQRNAELAQFRPLLNARIQSIKELDKQIELIDANPNMDYDAAIAAAERSERLIRDEYGEATRQVTTFGNIISKTGTLSINSQCPTCLQVITSDYLAKTSASYTKTYEDAKQRCVACNEKLIKVLEDIEQLKSTKASLAHKAYLVKHRADQNDMLNDAQRNIRRLVKESETYTEQLRKDQLTVSLLSAELNAVDATTMRMHLTTAQTNMTKLTKLCNERIDGIQSQMTDCQKQIATIEYTIKQYHKLNKRLVVERAKANECEKLINMYSILSEVFGKNGLQALMIENIVHTIEAFANDILAKMQTRFMVELRTQKQTQAGDDKETLQIIVFDNGTERSYESYSGGERTLLNVSLRLALARVITSYHNTCISGLFLDETFAALDDVNRDAAVKILTLLAKEFQQCLVISHDAEIRDLIPASIIITRQEEYSTAEIV